MRSLWQILQSKKQKRHSTGLSALADRSAVARGALILATQATTVAMARDSFDLQGTTSVVI